MNCSVDGCKNIIYARGWCRRHYRHVVEGGHKEPLVICDTCNKCGNTFKPTAKSSGLCKKCYRQKWCEENDAFLQKYHTEYRKLNKAKISEQVKTWRQNNKEHVNAYYAKRRKDPQYRVAHNLRSRLYDALAGKVKNASTEELTGCSFEELCKHIESQFEEGMNWDNYGSYWVIDHKIPLISVDLTNSAELERVCHYSNLRPLTAIMNNSKATEDKLWKKS